MSHRFDSQKQTRKRDRVFDLLKRPFSRSNSDSGLGANIAHQASESDVRVQHHGHNFNTTNTGDGAVYNVGHIEHARFSMHDGEGSREGDVRAILRWTKSSPSGESVLWIHAAAGVGKSTLARHLTHILRADNRLGAVVSLGSIPSDARGPESVVKILAREVGTMYPSVIPLILSAISSCHGAPLVEHIKKYLRDPSRTLQSPSSLIFVLDAIDEWEYSDAFVKTLASITASSDTLKFILLSRSDPRTRGYEEAWVRSYRLEPVSDATMERYFVKEFALIKWDLGRKPSENQIAKLVELADGLFIWAMVTCSLLKKRLSRCSPSETLEAIIHSRRSVAAERGLSELYHQAMAWLFPTRDDQDLLRQYLGATLVLQEPLPVGAFSYFTKLPVHAVESVRETLAALQIRHPVGDMTRQIHPANALFHLSFVECCNGPQTPSNFPFSISVVESHSQLAKSCLLELHKFLPSANKLNPTDLSARQKYAVKHMPWHVHRGTPSVEPEFDADWKETPHFSLLQGIPTQEFIKWGRLFVALMLPSLSAGDTKIPGEPTSREGLLVDVAARLGKGPKSMLPVQISCLEVAVRLKPSNPHNWDQLGWAYRSLALSTHSRNLCDQAVQALQNAVRVDGTSDSDKGSFLHSLGIALNDRHDYLGSDCLHDLEEAITVFRRALVACRPGHPDYDTCLNNLAGALTQAGSVSHIQESIRMYRKTLELRPQGHPHRHYTLANLAVTLSRTGSVSDLHESIHLHRAALKLRPPGHERRGTTLSHLASALSNTGSAGGLQESIRLSREALELQPLGHPYRSITLNNLADALSKTGSIPNLHESIALYREALELSSSGHPHRAVFLRNLAKALERTGSPDDLRESTRLREEALES